MTALYDTIGLNYADLRRPDPRIAARIEAALGDAEDILNVGAGAGNYEPQGRRVTALEPSAEMITQRRHPAHKLVQGVAEDLPFPDQSFDAAMAILTVHHWSDKARGLQELRRVSRGPIAILTFDPAFRDIWLLDYLPQNAELDARNMMPLEMFADHLGPVDIAPVPIPHDCTDGFLYSYWRRPQAYLDPRLRAASSTFHLLKNLDAGLARLEKDLADGTWDQRYGHLMARDTLDCGYRLIIAR